MSFSCDGAETRVIIADSVPISHEPVTQKTSLCKSTFSEGNGLFSSGQWLLLSGKPRFFENMRTFFDDVHSFLVGPMLFKETVALV